MDNNDVIKVEVLVQEFLEQSSLQVLPKNQFVDTLVQFVEKGGSGAMEEFVNEALSKSLKSILKMDEQPDFDVDQAVESWREAAEQRWAKNGGDPTGPQRRLKSRPEDYDSDFDGPWGGDDDHYFYEAPAQASKANGRGRRSISDDDVEMEDGMFVSQVDDPVVLQPSKGRRGAAAKNAPAKKAPAKKTPAPKKVPATRGRPEKKSGFVIDSDEEEEEEAHDDAMSEDMFMDDEEDDPPAPPPKRATRATKVPAPKKATPRATKAMTASNAKQAKQTTLNFSQSQRPVATRDATQTQKTMDISDDEIDDDDDDAFEPVAPPTRGRRR